MNSIQTLISSQGPQEQVYDGEYGTKLSGIDQITFALHMRDAHRDLGSDLDGLSARVGTLETLDLGLTARVEVLESEFGAGGLRLSDVPPTVRRFTTTDEAYQNAGSNGTNPLLHRMVAIRAVTFSNLRLPQYRNAQTGLYTTNNGAPYIYEVLNRYMQVVASGTAAPVDNDPSIWIADLNTSVTFGAGEPFYLRVYGAEGKAPLCNTHVARGSFTTDGDIQFIDTDGVGYGPLIEFASGHLQRKQVIGPLDLQDLPGFRDAPIGSRPIKVSDESLGWTVVTESGTGTGTGTGTASPLTETSNTTGGAANFDVLAPAAAGFLRRITTLAPGTIGVYLSSADRQADTNRLDNTPTAVPTVDLLAQVATSAGNLTVAVGEAYNQQTLYVRVSNANTVKLGIETSEGSGVDLTPLSDRITALEGAAPPVADLGPITTRMNQLEVDLFLPYATLVLPKADIISGTHRNTYLPPELNGRKVVSVTDDNGNGHYYYPNPNGDESNMAPGTYVVNEGQLALAEPQDGTVVYPVVLRYQPTLESTFMLKLDKPRSDGTPGQVLTLDADGKATWADAAGAPAGGSIQQVNLSSVTESAYSRRSPAANGYGGNFGGSLYNFFTPTVDFPLYALEDRAPNGQLKGIVWQATGELVATGTTVTPSQDGTPWQTVFPEGTVLHAGVRYLIGYALVQSQMLNYATDGNMPKLYPGFTWESETRYNGGANDTFPWRSLGNGYHVTFDLVQPPVGRFKNVFGPLDPADMPAVYKTLLTRVTALETLATLPARVATLEARKPRLSGLAATFGVLNPQPTFSDTYGSQSLIELTPNADYSFEGVRDTHQAVAGMVFRIFRVSDGLLIWQSSPTIVASDPLYPVAPIILTAGVTYAMGWGYANSQNYITTGNTGTPTMLPGFTAHNPPIWRYQANPIPGMAPLNPYEQSRFPSWELATGGMAKGVVGPLDEADLPVAFKARVAALELNAPPSADKPLNLAPVIQPGSTAVLPGYNAAGSGFSAGTGSSEWNIAKFDQAVQLVGVRPIRYQTQGSPHVTFEVWNMDTGVMLGAAPEVQWTGGTLAPDIQLPVPLMLQPNINYGFRLKPRVDEYLSVYYGPVSALPPHVTYWGNYAGGDVRAMNGNISHNNVIGDFAPILGTVAELVSGRLSLDHVARGTEIANLLDHPAAGGGTTAPLFARAEASASQSIQGGAWIKVQFGRTVSSGSGAMVAGTFTAPKAGVYQVNAGVVFSGSNGLYVNATVRKNGVECIKLGEDNIAGAFAIALTSSGAVELAVGDVLEVFAYVGNGCDIFGDPAKGITTFDVTLVQVGSGGGAGISVVTDKSLVPAGSVALVDDGATAPRFAFRRADKTLFLGPMLFISAELLGVPVNTSNWTRVDAYNRVGVYKSPPTGDNANSSITFPITVPSNGVLSVDIMTSSEGNFDFLDVAILDGQGAVLTSQSRSGLRAWEGMTFNVGNGAKSLKFVYRKDSGGTVGDDAVYFDPATISFIPS